MLPGQAAGQVVFVTHHHVAARIDDIPQAAFDVELDESAIPAIDAVEAVVLCLQHRAAQGIKIKDGRRVVVDGGGECPLLFFYWVLAFGQQDSVDQRTRAVRIPRRLSHGVALVVQPLLPCVERSRAEGAVGQHGFDQAVQRIVVEQRGDAGFDQLLLQFVAVRNGKVRFIFLDRVAFIVDDCASGADPAQLGCGVDFGDRHGVARSDRDLLGQPRLGLAFFHDHPVEAVRIFEAEHDHGIGIVVEVIFTKNRCGDHRAAAGLESRQVVHETRRRVRQQRLAARDQFGGIG